jgi:hypothetical protein
MVPSPNASGFVARVPEAGFRWVSKRELEAIREAYEEDRSEERPIKEGGLEGPFEKGQFLISGDISGDRRYRRQPVVEPALFRVFAELDYGNLDSLAAFANANGWLHMSTKKVIFLADGEAFLVWQKAIATMRVAVTVLDAIRGQDLRTLRQLFSWKPSPFNRVEGVPTHVWTLDTHPDDPRGKQFPPGRVFGITVFARDTGQESITMVARRWLARQVNLSLDGEVSPELVVTEDGERFTETMIPHTLSAALWSQVFEAITQDVLHRKCPACSRWFAIGGKQENAHRRSRLYCSNACRVRACQKRQERAQELAAKGMTPAAIVKTLLGEGHETDLATVRGWVRGIKRKGDKR